MAQRLGGTAGYGISNQPNFGGTTTSDAANETTLDAIRKQTSRIEDALDTLSDPVKP